MTKPRAPSRDADGVDDDAMAFRSAVRDVKPLAHAPRAGLPRPKSRARLRKSADLGADATDDSMPLVSGGEAPIGGGDVLRFQRNGVRTQVLRRLRRGLIPIEGELDLHGMSQSAARDQLADFLAYSRHCGRRCVRIIHGKGYRSGARGPILKIAVDLWLRRHLDVMAFTSARTLDGGTGAVYVLLRA